MADLALPDGVLVPVRLVMKVIEGIILEPNAVKTDSRQAPGGSAYTEINIRVVVLGMRYTLRMVYALETQCHFYLYQLHENRMRWRIEGRVQRNAPFFRNGMMSQLRDEDITFLPPMEGHLIQPDLALLVVALG